MALHKGTTILYCTCANTGQDKLYGRGLRVHNATGPKKQAAGEPWRCSVCAKSKQQGK